MEATAGRCIRCGGGLPVRVDPRGRPARYCSDACRASASRERASAGARAARVQAEARAYERGKKDGYAEGWAEALRASTGRAGARMEPAVVAGEQHLPGMATGPVAAGMSRQQRRAAERAARKNGGAR